MKKIKLIVFISALFQPLLINCQIDFDKQYDISVKAIDAIRGNDFETFSTLVNEDILAESDKEVFKGLIETASQIVNKYDTIAPKDLLLIGISQTVYKGKQIDILSVSFQFPPPTKQTMISDQNLMFQFAEEIDKEKLVGFRIQDFTAHEKEIAEKAKKIPYLDSFDFKLNNIDWFRIWYDKGPTESNLGNQEGVYALSGDRKTIKKAKIESIISDIFELVNKAPIDSTDINTKLGIQTMGKSEYLYLRLKFKNSDYKKLNEFTMTTIFNEEKGTKEPNKEYLIIRHSRSHRYFIKMGNQELLKEKLIELAYLNHGRLLERNP